MSSKKSRRPTMEDLEAAEVAIVSPAPATAPTARVAGVENRPNVNPTPTLKAGRQAKRVRVDAVQLRGHYVRPFVDDQEFQDLKASILAAGGVLDYPITLRTEGGLTDEAYVLVDGMRRYYSFVQLRAEHPGDERFEYIEAYIRPGMSEHQAWLLQSAANDLSKQNHIVNRALHLHHMIEAGLDQDDIMQRGGFRSIGSYSELRRIGRMLVGISEEEHIQLVRARGITRMFLIGLLQEDLSPQAYKAAVFARAADAEAADVSGEGQGSASTKTLPPKPTRGKSRSLPTLDTKANRERTNFSFRMTLSARHFRKRDTRAEAVAQAVTHLREMADAVADLYERVTGEAFPWPQQLSDSSAPPSELPSTAELNDRSRDVARQADDLAAKARDISRMAGASGTGIRGASRLAAQSANGGGLFGPPRPAQRVIPAGRVEDDEIGS